MKIPVQQEETTRVITVGEFRRHQWKRMDAVWAAILMFDIVLIVNFILIVFNIIRI